MIRVVTDNASDMTVKDADDLNVDLINLPITFGDEEFPQKTEEDFEAFFERLAQVDKLPKTSRGSLVDYYQIFKEAKDAGDDVICVTLSKTISGSIDSAYQAKEALDYDRVFIVDSALAVTGQRLLVEAICQRRNEGATAESIVEEANSLKKRIIVYGLIDTLRYLKMGGRIPSAFASLGDVLQIKPLITLDDGNLDGMGLARGHKAGIKKIKRKFKDNGYDTNYPVYFAYTPSKANAVAFMEEMIKEFDLTNTKLLPVGGVVGTHIGTDALAIIFVQKENE